MKAIFLDKDGTLVENLPYNVDPEKIRLVAGADQGLKCLAEAGYRMVVVTNQSGVARGYFRETDLAPVREEMMRLLGRFGVELAGFYYCPHHPLGTITAYTVECSCRKPAPGLLYRAAEDMDIELDGSWMIGDILDDIEAGKRAGCRTILIDNGNETEWVLTSERVPDYRARDLFEAAQIIVRASGSV